LKSTLAKAVTRTKQVEDEAKIAFPFPRAQPTPKVRSKVALAKHVGSVKLKVTKEFRLLFPGLGRRPEVRAEMSVTHGTAMAPFRSHVAMPELRVVKIEAESHAFGRLGRATEIPPNARRSVLSFRGGVEHPGE
jgi:hypothetical protein